MTCVLPIHAFFAVGLVMAGLLTSPANAVAQQVTDEQVAQMLDGYYAAVSFDDRLPFISQDASEVRELAAKVYGDLENVNPAGYKRLKHQVITPPRDNGRGAVRVAIESFSGEKSVVTVPFVVRDGKCRIDWIESLKPYLAEKGLLKASRIAKDDSIKQISVFDIGKNADSKVAVLGLTVSGINNSSSAGFTIGWPKNMDRDGWVQLVTFDPQKNMQYMFCRTDARHFEAIEQAHRNRTQIDVVGSPMEGGPTAGTKKWTLFILDAANASGAE
jgi:hypothetical protein